MKLSEFLDHMRGLLKGSTFEGKCYIVGGVPRDHLLGRQDFNDFDLVVESPYGGLKLGAFLSHRIKPESYQTFPKFGTARMEIWDIKLDFVETRKEVYHRGRRYPRISFGSIQDDVYRRDFSINALYLEIFKEELLDPCGKGKEELQQRVINTIREPEIVFKEDVLRILRALRFSAVLGFEIDARCKDAIRESLPGIKRLSAGSLKKELDKIPDAKTWARAQALGEELGLKLADFAPDAFH